MSRIALPFLSGNNRTNSYVEDGKLFLQPTLTSDYLGEDQLRNGTVGLGKV